MLRRPGRMGASLVLASALALAAGACAGGDRSSLDEDGSAGQTIPGVATAPVARRGDVVAAAEVDDPDGGTVATEAGDGATGPMTTGGSAPSTAGAGDGPAAEDGPAADDPGTDSRTSYPPITDETFPPAPGLGAVLSPAGVLVDVRAETVDGYVVVTPCGGVTTIPWGQPVGPVQVVLDPGHGGDEPGATDVPGLTEADLNLAVARRTAAELTRRAVGVALTRNGDYRIPIRRRAELADSLAPAALVSIHHNTPSSRPSTTPGTEVFVQSESADSRRLGGLLYEEVVGELSQFDVEWTARDDAGVLVVLDDDGIDAYGIARYPDTPSALVELAYLGNPLEAALLATDEYLEAAARALADGVERYLTTADPGSGFVATPRAHTGSGGTGGVKGCFDPPLE